jgi:hypothetical protein
MTYYVYDVRTIMEKPVFIAYDAKNVDLILNALYGCRPEFVLVSNVRLHKHNKEDLYLGRASAKR